MSNYSNINNFGENDVISFDEDVFKIGKFRESVKKALSSKGVADNFRYSLNPRIDVGEVVDDNWQERNE